jgi:hypothetical protein
MDGAFCRWEWLGDVWDKTQDCPRPDSPPPHPTCAPPGFQGTFIGQVETTPCTS